MIIYLSFVLILLLLKFDSNLLKGELSLLLLKLKGFVIALSSSLVRLTVSNLRELSIFNQRD